MNLPMLWLAAAFAAGIEAARHSYFSVAECALAALASIIVAAIFLWRKQAAIAWTLALIAWAATGAAAARVQAAKVDPINVGQLMAAGRLDASSPLRWQGRLRSDPADRPWGREYLIHLERVEVSGVAMPVHGGLRLTLYGDDLRASDDTGELRAGDGVEALVKAQTPRDFNDPGAFDARGYLAAQDIDLTGSLRNAKLLTLISRPEPGLRQRLARIHGALLARVDELFSRQPESAALLRAMLLGDRSFVDTTTVVAFQKTAAYHILVVAGLHTGALVVFLLWLCRRLRLGIAPTILITLGALAAYVGVVEDRAPILRAALMATIYLLVRPLFRRIDLLNIVALAALCLLTWNPAFAADSGFQLSFLAAGVIAALAVPWMQRTTAPYLAGLAHLGDVTRDVVHPPKIAQFRIETRAAAKWLSTRFPRAAGARSTALITTPVRLGLRLCELFCLSIAIQLGMLPLLAQDFHRISISGPISNIPAVLLTGIIVPVGFVCLAASFLWAHAAVLLATVLAWLTLLLLHSVQWFSRLPHLSYRIPGPPLWLTLSFFAALVAVAAFGRRVVAQRRGRAARRTLPAPVSWQEWAAAAALIVAALLIAIYPFSPRLARGKTEVTVLDVGQGDSIFVSFPDGETMLVDGGGLAGSEWIKGTRSAPDVGEEVVSPYLWSRGIKRLDIVALTHAHEDHLGGLASVLDNFHVGQLWIGRDENTPEFRNLLAEARRLGVTVVHKSEGEDLAWGAVRGEVLWPPVEDPVDEASNDDSLAIRIEDGATSFLLTGDIQAAEERKILAEGVPLTSDFLKVPHHGSKTSSTEPFLEAVQPRFAAVSVGAGNAYGHPSESVVDRYAEDGVRLLRTDRDGAITALSDGRKLAVRAFVSTEGGAVLAQARRQAQ
ncbi:MAG TPA: DNA internalization-related competence protein ComEC/Rec2 [Candidatus Acidoferrales bacterium]|nr:DNA internalization-related competence protein ComEC/Rec2 [Candidatus Acidoferrales bacterium]